MYDQFYGFSERPFSLLPDPDFLFLGDKHRTALDALELAIFNQSGFCVISGAIGAGKTTLIRELLNRLDAKVQVGLVSNTHPSFGELMQWIMAAFGLPCETSDRLDLHKRFVDYAIQRYAEGKHTLLIIDEAQNLSLAALEELRMLSNVNSGKDLILQIILVGQSELRDKLRTPELVQFAQRISIDYYLDGLTVEETCLYIQHRIAHVGGAQDLFTPDACRRVHAFSQGIPRVINRLCDLSLVYGFAAQRQQIGADLVEAVAREQRLGETMEAARQRAGGSPATPSRAVVEPLRVEAEIPPALLTPPPESSDVSPEPDVHPEPEVHAELRVKSLRDDDAGDNSEPSATADTAADLHTLVVNAERAGRAKGERIARWLFVGVVVMVGATAWMSRGAWFPTSQDVAVKVQVPVDAAEPVEDAARLATQRAAEQAKREQARIEKAEREKAARLAKQRAAEKAKQEQARIDKAKREKAARLAKQRAAEQAKREQAKREQARIDKAEREKAARLAKQRAAEQAKREQARIEQARRQDAVAAKANVVPAAEERRVLRPAVWADTPEWSEEDEEEVLTGAPVAEAPVVTADAPEMAAADAAEQDNIEDVSEPEGFTTNPCNGPTARFLSTCR